MKQKFYKVEQSSEEWFNLRLGLITASNFGKIMANEGKVFGNPAIEYAERIAIEGVTQRRIETYQNEWMLRGIELEPDARELYEQETFNQVQPGGFVRFDAFGGSADGIVNNDGLIEIKSVKFNTHFKLLRAEGYDLSYKWQIQGNIWLYQREWCDFISYCPDFPASKQLHIYRVKRDQELIDRLVIRLNEFEAFVKSLKRMIA